MTIFLTILLATGIVSTIVYAGLALGYRYKSAGEAKTNFLTFVRMYKIVPDKWGYNEFYHYLIYYPDGKAGYKLEYVYMDSYFEHLQLYLWNKVQNREREKKDANKKTSELYECFLRDALGTNKEEKKPDEENDPHRKFYSSDALPTKGVPNGYVIKMEDTKDVFIFDAERQTWIQHMPLE